MPYETRNITIDNQSVPIGFWKRPDNSFVTVHTMAYERAEEQRSESDLNNGDVTFNMAIEAVEIFNRSPNDGVFRVNGINFIVPALTTWRSAISGTPSVTVAVTGSASFLITRLV